MDDRADLDPMIGRRLAGKYEVLDVLGRGAMGIVYKAKQVALDKSVALKVLSHDLRDDAEFVTRFHTEARAASRLDHPNSTRVLDFGDDGGLLYIAMELLDGRTLARVIREESPMPTERVASIMSQALSAVGAAHKLGILHRDLKTDNIVILAGRDEDDRLIDVVKVCDFGIAKLEGSAEPKQTGSDEAPQSIRGATRAGHIVGTPEYMSPEQASGEPGSVDTRSDLYSLGCVMYEMLTGKTPFESTSTAMVLSMHMLDQPQPPSALEKDVDPRLEAICLRALQKRKEDRYASAKEMRVELRPLAGKSETVSPVTLEQSGSSLRTFDPTAPTMPHMEAPQRARSWVAIPLLLVIVFGGGYVGWKLRHPDKVAVTTPVIETTTSSISVMATEPVASADAPAASTLIAPVVPTHRATSARTNTAPSVDTTPEPTVTAPPPASTPPAVTTAPAVSTAPIATAPIIVVDPSRAHADVGHIQPDRINVASVESGLRHIDFTGCYRAALTQFKSPIQGTGTLEIEMDEERMLRAVLSGGDFPSSMRQCVATRALAARVPNVDTGNASAKVTLKFSLQ